MRTVSRAALVVAAIALGGCAVVRVPVKVAGTTVGTALLVVTRDAQHLPSGTPASGRH